MPLSEAQAQAIDDWILNQGGKALQICPACGTDGGFGYGELVVPPLADCYGKMRLDAPSDPLLTIECSCGYVFFMRARRIPGLILEPPPRAQLVPVDRKRGQK